MKTKEQINLDKAEAILHQIANDYIELSHEKVMLQRNDYIRWAKKYFEDTGA